MGSRKLAMRVAMMMRAGRGGDEARSSASRLLLEHELKMKA